MQKFVIKTPSARSLLAGLRFYYFFSFFIILLFSRPLQANELSSTALQKADALYDEGNCSKALEAYKSIPKSEIVPSSQDDVLYKTSSCQFELEMYPQAEVGFKNYLKKNPASDEAQLMYAETLLLQSKYAAAKAVAKQVKSSEFLPEAAIILARAQIETEEFTKAIANLKHFSKDEDSAAEIQYWLGVAYYQSDADESAESSFEAAEKLADKDSWVKVKAKGWLDKIKENKQKFHVQLNIGTFNDSNVAQTGNYLFLTPANPGVLQSTGNIYTVDTGGYAAIDFIHQTYASRKFYLTSTLSLSSPFYAWNPSYDLESASFEVSAKAIVKSNFNYGASLKYLNTWYAGIYSQDYLFLTPFSSWSPASEFWIKFSVPTTAYLNAKKIYVVSPSLDFFYDPLDWLSTSAGISSSRSTGPPTVVTGNIVQSVSSGTLFSHYTTNGGYLSLSFTLPAQFQLSLTESIYRSAYELESFSSTPGPPFARLDNLKTYQIGLEKALIKNIWSASLTFTYFENISNGFSGLNSFGYFPNNSYTRSYSLFSTTVYY